MTYKFDGFNWIVRLEKGELLMESLKKIIKDGNLPSCWIMGLGAARRAELGFYDLDQNKYNWQKFDQLMEITSLQGNSSWQGRELSLHIHGTFADDKFQSFGGHVKELEVGGTCELLLHRWYSDNWTRSRDDKTGLNLLDI